MSGSVQKQRMNRDTVADNQTIFDFLKRKKQFNLQNTVNKSVASGSLTKRKIQNDLDEEFPQTRDLTKYRTYESNRYAMTARQTVTPKKIEFDDQSHQPNRSVNKEPVQEPDRVQQHRRGKSFLSLISPIKARPASALEQRREQNQSVGKSQANVAKAKGESYTRGKLTKCLNSIKETVTVLGENIKKVKEKSHGLSVLFNPFFNKFVDPHDPSTRTVGDLRNKLKAFQASIEGMQVDNCDEVMGNLHRNLEEHIQSQLNQAKKQFSKSKDQELTSLKQQKEVKIDSLQQQLKKVKKENDLLARRLEIVQNSKGEVQAAIEEKDVQFEHQIENFKNKMEATIEQLRKKNQELEQKLKQTQGQAREAEKSYKNERMVKESLQQKYQQQIQAITEVKDAYLLNQIMVLKTEFNADLARMNELHRIKQADLLNRLNEKDKQLGQKMFEKGCDKQIQSKVLQQANQIKQQNIILKQKSECIVTDMYRMNEQLYQHWMALKDIKILSNRLGTFAQFRKIYEDLHFNDHLFH